MKSHAGMMTRACVNVLCKITAGGGIGGGRSPPELQNLDKDSDTVSQYVLSSATLIWQCDVIHDAKWMNMTNRDGNDEAV